MIRFNELGGHPTNVNDLEESLPLLPADFPKVITLVGSSRFKWTFHEQGYRLEKQGCLVLMMAFFSHVDCKPVDDQFRAVLDETDRRRIDLSDEVLVINEPCWCCGTCHQPTKHVANDVFVCAACGMRNPSQVVREPYVGPSTTKEIDYALKTGVKVSYLHPPAPTKTQE